MHSLSDDLKRFGEFWWGDRGFSALLVLLLVIMFFSPFLELRLARSLLSIFFILLLISGVPTVTERKLHRAAAAVVIGTALVANILNAVIPGRAITGLYYFSGICFFVLLIGVLLRRVFRKGPVTAHRIRGAVAAYLLIGITWAFIYQLIAFIDPRAFSFPASMTAQPGAPEHEASLAYFSFVTMATLGYGDIVPVHPGARMFAISEALIGQLYPAILLARLVSLQIIYREDHPDKDSRHESGKRGDS